MNTKKRIGIVGYGKLGQFMVQQILTHGERLNIELVFVWNRTPIEKRLPARVVSVVNVHDIEHFGTLDLIVEVCHPTIVKQYGYFLLQHADLLVGSSTALADEKCRQEMLNPTGGRSHRVLLARGALWGANDIQRMARHNLLESVRVEMHFHPNSLRLAEQSTLRPLNDDVLRSNSTEARVLFEGPVRTVCHLAPNNVNTMATVALIGLGLDQTVGCLVSNPSLTDHHKIVVQVTGVRRSNTSKQFQVHCTRESPISNETNVSSTQTFDAFWQSILECLDIRPDDRNLVYVC